MTAREAPPDPPAAASLRSELTRGEDTVDVATWAGSVPEATGVSPRVRLGSKWLNLLWLLPLGFVVLLIAVAVAKGLREMPAVAEFIARHPGAATNDPPDVVGIPVWSRWQHFFNLFLMIFILRSGLQILSDHPRLYWTQHCTPGRDWFRVQKPVPPDPLWTAKQDSISLPRQVGLPGLAALDRSGPLVAPRYRHPVAAQRAGVLRPVVRHRALAPAGAHQAERCSPTRARC